MSKEYEITIPCPFCCKKKTYKFNEDEYRDAKALKDGAPAISIRRPTYFRELFITGMCYECFAKTFNVSTPGFDLGPEKGECPNCSCQLHQKDIDANKCPSCGFPLDADIDDFM